MGPYTFHTSKTLVHATRKCAGIGRRIGGLCPHGRANEPRMRSLSGVPGRGVRWCGQLPVAPRYCGCATRGRGTRTEARDGRWADSRPSARLSTESGQYWALGHTTVWRRAPACGASTGFAEGADCGAGVRVCACVPWVGVGRTARREGSVIDVTSGIRPGRFKLSLVDSRKGGPVGHN